MDERPSAPQLPPPCTRLRRPVPRRQALGWIGGLVGAAAFAGTGLTGCDRPREAPGAPAPAPADPVLRLAVTALPVGERQTRLLGGWPVELLRRDDDNFVARSLTCTHFACRVAWDPERERYLCPCHEGEFAPDGRVLGGAPTEPLPAFPVERTGDAVVVRLPAGWVPLAEADGGGAS